MGSEITPQQWAIVAVALYGLMLVVVWCVSHPPKSQPRDASNLEALWTWLQGR